MATELQATLNRIISKSEVLLSKYSLLEEEKEAAERENESLRERLEAVTRELEKIKADYKYLQVARTLPASQEAAAAGRAVLAKLVQDIDRCISQLME